MSEVVLLTLVIGIEQDVVLVRQRARQTAELVGFEAQDCTRIATAVSEIARNAFMYAGGGRVEYALAGSATEGQRLRVTVTDTGPGISDITLVLSGRYHSATGMGHGILGTRRIMDNFEIESVPGKGTRVVLEKFLPRSVFGLDAFRLKGIAEELAKRRPGDAVHELQSQNQELLRLLNELREKDAEQTRLNRELDDTNRGVVALYSELDVRAQQLRAVNNLQAQFMSYMSHEFRTPLDSILALSALLLARVDGDLGDEQEKQVSLIRSSARDLLNLVDDILDHARVEAGQAALRLSVVYVEDLFNALRATLRPLVTNAYVRLEFEDHSENRALYTDDGKVSQILRNLASNALKFTDRGEVIVSAESGRNEEFITFYVRDTGIGIPEESRRRIFEDFAQVESPVQRHVRGTGLGLPLSRKLAELLGGTLTLEDVRGRGSCFAVRLPVTIQAPQSEVA